MPGDLIDEVIDELPATPERERYRQYLHAKTDLDVRRVIASAIDDGTLPPEALPFAERIKPIEVPDYDPASYEFAPVVDAYFAQLWEDVTKWASSSGDDAASQ